RMVAADPGVIVTGEMTGEMAGGVAGGAREVVLGRIRAALGAAPAPAPAAPRSYRTTGEHPPGSEPVLRLFGERLRDYRATVHTVGADGVGNAIADVLPAGGRILVPPGLPPEWAPPGAVADAGFDAASLDGF